MILGTWWCLLFLTLSVFFCIDGIRYSNPDNFKDYYLWKKIIQNKLNENDFFLRESYVLIENKLTK